MVFKALLNRRETNMKISEILNENEPGSPTNWGEIFKQIDARERAGIPRKYPVIGGVERTPEVIRAEIARGGTLETEPLDHEHFQKWQQQQKEKSRAPNFLGIGDMLNKDDELRKQKAATAKAPASSRSLGLKNGGGRGGSTDYTTDIYASHSDPRLGADLDPVPAMKQYKYDLQRKSLK